MKNFWGLEKIKQKKNNINYAQRISFGKKEKTHVKMSKNAGVNDEQLSISSYHFERFAGAKRDDSEQRSYFNS